MTTIAPEGGLDFTQAHLETYLNTYDPQLQLKGPSDHIAAIPGRPDLLLRWTKPLPNYVGNRAEDLQEQINCHEDRLGALAVRGIIIPEHTSFIVDCPWQRRPTIYTVVKKMPIDGGAPKPGSDEALSLGHTLLDHYEHDITTGEPYIWDISKRHQYTLNDGKPALLDLDAYLTRDPRTPYRGVLNWVSLDSSPAWQDLHKRTLAAKARANELYWTDVNGCASPLWAPGYSWAPISPSPAKTIEAAQSQPTRSGGNIEAVAQAIAANTRQAETAGEDIIQSRANIVPALESFVGLAAQTNNANLAASAAALVEAGERAVDITTALTTGIGQLAAYRASLIGEPLAAYSTGAIHVTEQGQCAPIIASSEKPKELPDLRLDISDEELLRIIHDFAKSKQFRAIKPDKIYEVPGRPDLLLRVAPSTQIVEKPSTPWQKNAHIKRHGAELVKLHRAGIPILPHTSHIVHSFLQSRSKVYTLVERHPQPATFQDVIHASRTLRGVYDAAMSTITGLITYYEGVSKEEEHAGDLIAPRQFAAADGTLLDYDAYLNTPDMLATTLEHFALWLDYLPNTAEKRAVIQRIEALKETLPLQNF